jgi:DNA-binding transcriptional MerR regulator
MIGKVFYKQLKEEVLPDVEGPTLRWWLGLLGLGTQEKDGKGNKKEFSESDIRTLIVFKHLRLAGVSTDMAVAMAKGGSHSFEFGPLKLSIDEEKVKEIMDEVGR